MKKLEKRSIICLTMAAVLFLGVCVFTYRFVTQGSDWATFYANQHIYSEGRLAIGTIYDVNGTLLAENDNGEVLYNDDETIRRATVHAVGDLDGNIATAAKSAFKSRLVGYNLLTGTYSVTGKGNDLTLTIDADICKTAYEALAGRDGLVGVYNYETGEIICMVSSPGFDLRTRRRWRRTTHLPVYQQIPVGQSDSRIYLQAGHLRGGHREPGRSGQLDLHLHGSKLYQR